MIYEETRPWGKFEVLLDAPDCKVKRITISPGQSPSYQYHFKRSEVWVVVSGKGSLRFARPDGVACDSVPMGAGDTVTIGKEVRHQFKNTSKTEPLVFIETQLGEYFGEDDIVRVEDNYGRV
jgi:mannose-6-phosphate isomerase